MCKVDQQENGHYPAHMFIVMVIHYLQQRNPPVLPVLHEVGLQPTVLYVYSVVCLCIWLLQLGKHIAQYAQRCVFVVCLFFLLTCKVLLQFSDDCCFTHVTLADDFNKSFFLLNMHGNATGQTSCRSERCFIWSAVCIHIVYSYHFFCF